MLHNKYRINEINVGMHSETVFINILLLYRFSIVIYVFGVKFTLFTLRKNWFRNNVTQIINKFINERLCNVNNLKIYIIFPYFKQSTYYLIFDVIIYIICPSEIILYMQCDFFFFFFFFLKIYIIYTSLIIVNIMTLP